MDHSIKLHTRVSHFLTTLDETVNMDFDLEDQVPLSKIWDDQDIPEVDVVFLGVKLEEARLNCEKGWEFAFEDETCMSKYGYPGFEKYPEMPERTAGIFYLHDGNIAIVGKFYNGSESGEGKNGNYTWFFKKVA